MGANNVTGVTLLNALAVANLVTNAGTSTLNNIAGFTGKVVNDAGIAKADLLLRTGTVAMTGVLDAKR